MLGNLGPDHDQNRLGIAIELASQVSSALPPSRMSTRWGRVVRNTVCPVLLRTPCLGHRSSPERFGERNNKSWDHHRRLVKRARTRKKGAKLDYLRWSRSSPFVRKGFGILGPSAGNYSTASLSISSCLTRGISESLPEER